MMSDRIANADTILVEIRAKIESRKASIAVLGSQIEELMAMKLTVEKCIVYKKDKR